MKTKQPKISYHCFDNIDAYLFFIWVTLAPRKTYQTKQTGDMRDLKWREMKPMFVKIATANWKLENNDKVTYMSNENHLK